MPAGTFFDGATVHLVTTATLNRLRGWYPQGRFEVPRFRPNIVLESAAGEELGMVEETWIGLTLAIGDDVRLRITGPCGRCVMTTLAQGDLPKDSGILRTATQRAQGHVGGVCRSHARRCHPPGRSRKTSLAHAQEKLCDCALISTALDSGVARTHYKTFLLTAPPAWRLRDHFGTRRSARRPVTCAAEPIPRHP
ncbi:MAG TPA: MOSC domain-containing protein, partial [Nitrospiraceae bacterium]|nr:MOSC domain-containing protein [Nitrospiraceae bacterium]